MTTRVSLRETGLAVVLFPALLAILAAAAACSRGAATLQPGDSLSLVVSPGSLSKQCPAAFLDCGAPPNCLPGLGRSATITVVATGAAGPVPNGVGVTLMVSPGWLVPGGESCGAGGVNEQEVYLFAGAGGATWCVDDAGGSGILTANSNGVDASVPVQAVPVAAAIVLQPASGTARPGEASTFVAAISDCNGRGIGGSDVIFSTTGEPDADVVTTDAGIAVYSITVGDGGPTSGTVTANFMACGACTSTWQVRP